MDGDAMIASDEKIEDIYNCLKDMLKNGQFFYSAIEFGYDGNGEEYQKKIREFVEHVELENS